MQTNGYPNLFIAGAPKCGTTSLAYYLGQHPEVFNPIVKEPIYFGSDLTAKSRLGLNEYLQLYKKWAAQKYAMDASTHYFYSSQAAEEIAAASPSAEILIMVRNPVDAAHSMYHQLRFNGAETLVSFEASLSAELVRSSDRRPTRFGFPENLLYRNVYAYSKNIARFEAVFGVQRVHIVLLDDLKTDPMREVKRVCRDLKLETAPVDGFSFSTKNAAKRPRARWVNTLANYPPGWLRIVTAPFPRSLRIRVRKQLARLNTTPTVNARLEPATRSQLSREFAGEVHWLSDRLDRDLTHWLASDDGN